MAAVAASAEAAPESVESLCAREEAERKRLKPAFSLADAAAVARETFHLEGARVDRELNSYDDQNWRVVDVRGRAYVLKAHNGVEGRNGPLLRAQSRLFARLSERGVRAPTEASPLARARGFTWRLLDWVPGDLLSASTITPALLERSGAFLGEIRGALDAFDDPALHRAHLWDLRRFPALKTFADRLGELGCDAERSASVARAFRNFDESVAPLADALPMATLHADFNDANVLVDGDAMGVIDVGDSVYSWRVNDAAVGLAYVLVTLATPENATAGFAPGDCLEGGRAFVRGYETRADLTAAEKTALPHLAAGRLATSFTLGWFSYHESLVANPDMPKERRDYLLHHALPAANALQRLLENPDFLRDAA